MKIALIGYGKMGRIIETLAAEKGDEIVARIDETNSEDLTEQLKQMPKRVSKLKFLWLKARPAGTAKKKKLKI
jgi:6-phosphogluconate dehydrogenase (decarboxylating)